jgi:acyl-coenzyme A synthetase/AMP-(fatty) acid ligase
MTECMPISSPPATYQLEKPGTSGVPVGPQVAILDLATSEPLPVGEEGPICVRGQPCFRGYGQPANSRETPNSSFLKSGWFDTGDLGYLDADGYLFITGRTKEVINRGGEIISPMEVEEAVARHPDIVTCAALSALHNVLQEVVGLALVVKAGRPRLDLPTLHHYLGERLAAPKWPQCLIYMDDLPKSHTNKLLRVKLAMAYPPLERTFEATCPPNGTALGVLIPAKRVQLSVPSVSTALYSQLVTSSNQGLLVVPHPSRPESLVCYLANLDRLHDCLG